MNLGDGEARSTLSVLDSRIRLAPGSADEDFDRIIKDKWLQHLKTLSPESARSTVWKSNYRKKWVHDLDIVAEDDILEAVIEASGDDDDDKPPHDVTDSSSDEDTPDVQVAVALHRSLRKRGVYLQRAKMAANADPIDDTHDLTIADESIEGSPPGADDDRRAGLAVKKHHEQVDPAKSKLFGHDGSSLIAPGADVANEDFGHNSAKPGTTIPGCLCSGDSGEHQGYHRGRMPQRR